MTSEEQVDEGEFDEPRFKKGFGWRGTRGAMLALAEKSC